MTEKQVELKKTKYFLYLSASLLKITFYKLETEDKN